MKAIDIQELRQAAMRCRDLMELLNYSHKGLVEDKFAMMEPVFREFHRVASAEKITSLCLYVEQLQAEVAAANQYKESAESELARLNDIAAVSGGNMTIVIPRPELAKVSGGEKSVILLQPLVNEITRHGLNWCYEDSKS
ncbi:hypothetical protein [Pantoea ananatis]|uniref:hypothetical protein n=1 Tax=Pantoea ananas TaxID=553 RepID=UPI003CF31E6E